MSEYNIPLPPPLYNIGARLKFKTTSGIVLVVVSEIRYCKGKAGGIEIRYMTYAADSRPWLVPEYAAIPI